MNKKSKPKRQPTHTPECDHDPGTAWKLCTWDRETGEISPPHTAKSGSNDISFEAVLDQVPSTSSVLLTMESGSPSCVVIPSRAPPIIRLISSALARDCRCGGCRRPPDGRGSCVLAYFQPGEKFATAATTPWCGSGMCADFLAMGYKENSMRLLHYEKIRTCSCCNIPKPGNTLSACPGCKRTTYCSDECKERHWHKHKHRCSKLRSKYT